MGAAAVFTPDPKQGDLWQPITVRLQDIPRGRRLSAMLVYLALHDFLRAGQTELGERYTDLVIRQSPWLRDFGLRFVQKGLKTLQDLGIIRRKPSHGRRIIIITGRLRGRLPKSPAEGRPAQAPPQAQASAPTANPGARPARTYGPPSRPTPAAGAEAARKAAEAAEAAWQELQRRRRAARAGRSTGPPPES